MWINREEAQSMGWRGFQPQWIANFSRESSPQSVENSWKKDSAPKGSSKLFFDQSRFWIWTDKIARYRGLKIEQLSDFSTVRAGYPQFLGSYPQFGRYVV
jgi:hypothetical protein